MLKLGGWIVSIEAADNWIGQHPECGVRPGRITELTLEHFVLKRIGKKHGFNRIIILTWPKVCLS